jgi:repressor LexA
MAGVKIDETEVEVFDYIDTYSEEHTHPPSIRNIADDCFLSRATVVRYLDRLEAHGFIIREPGRARGITLTGKKPRL